MPSLPRRKSRSTPAEEIVDDEAMLDTPLDDADLQARLDAAADRRTPRSTRILVGVLLVLIGFALGAITGRASAEFQAMMAEQAAAQTDTPGTIESDTDPAAPVDLSQPVNGTVIALDGTSVFVELDDATTLRVVVSESATVSTVVSASLSEVRAGQQVTVEGFADERGVVTAERFTTR